VIPVKLDTPDFDFQISLSAKAHRDALLASNDAFIAAMNKAIRKGREKVRPGTFVDASPHVGARRIRGDVAISSCGSPAAMCFDAGGSRADAQAMK